MTNERNPAERERPDDLVQAGSDPAAAAEVLLPGVYIQEVPGGAADAPAGNSQPSSVEYTDEWSTAVAPEGDRLVAPVSAEDDDLDRPVILGRLYNDADAGQVPDGTSNTVLLSESPLGDDDEPSTLVDLARAGGAGRTAAGDGADAVEEAVGPIEDIEGLEDVL